MLLGKVQSKKEFEILNESRKECEEFAGECQVFVRYNFFYRSLLIYLVYVRK